MGSLKEVDFVDPREDPRRKGKMKERERVAREGKTWRPTTANLTDLETHHADLQLNRATMPIKETKRMMTACVAFPLG